MGLQGPQKSQQEEQEKKSQQEEQEKKSQQEEQEKKSQQEEQEKKSQQEEQKSQQEEQEKKSQQEEQEKKSQQEEQEKKSQQEEQEKKSQQEEQEKKSQQTNIAMPRSFAWPQRHSPALRLCSPTGQRTQSGQAFLDVRRCLQPQIDHSASERDAHQKTSPEKRKTKKLRCSNGKRKPTVPELRGTRVMDWAKNWAKIIWLPFLKNIWYI